MCTALFRPYVKFNMVGVRDKWKLERLKLALPSFHMLLCHLTSEFVLVSIKLYSSKSISDTSFVRT